MRRIVSPVVKERLVIGAICAASMAGTLSLFGSVPLVERMVIALQEALPYRASSSNTTPTPREF
ncbi:MAG: hypothetical protein KME20_25670 [Kaiparowitsia implicata GSE-PSE-MK54-09C]|nr:hypothetical protein [Kaiparowitsia implicata GSE-PSE-MK54-09C]